MKAIVILATATALLLADGYSEGQSLAGGVTSHFNSNFSATITNPMNAKGEMTTVDGSTTFSDANIACSATLESPFFEIGYSVDSFGEIVPSVAVDQDLDGVADISSIQFLDGGGAPIPSKNISGVCYSGIVSCSSGGWSNCKYYEWQYSGSQLLLALSLREDLSTCRCVNNSCGTISSSQKESLLSQMGNGIIGRLSEVHNTFAISQVQSTGQELIYYGQDYSNCNNNGYSPNNYTGSLDNKGAMVYADAMNDPDSPTYIMENSAYNNERTSTEKIGAFTQTEFSSDVLDSNTSNDIKNRQASIAGSTVGVDGGNTMSIAYQDQYVDEDGNTVTSLESGTIQKDSTPPKEYCEVYWMESNPEMFSDGTNRSSLSGKNVQTFQQRECINNQCPLNSGEAVKYDCGAISSFGETVAKFHAIDAATSDMICSSN